MTNTTFIPQDVAKRPREESFHQYQAELFINKLTEADELGLFKRSFNVSNDQVSSDMPDTSMNLSIIQGKITESRYKNDAELEEDVALMISNIFEIFPKGDQYYKEARRFLKIYRRFAEEVGLNFDSDPVFISRHHWKDNEKTLEEAEKRTRENFNTLLDDLKQDQEIPLDDLITRYKATPAQTDGTLDAGDVEALESSSFLDSEESDALGDTANSDHSLSSCATSDTTSLSSASE